jgi:hypothetical protein
MKHWSKKSGVWNNWKNKLFNLPFKKQRNTKAEVQPLKTYSLFVRHLKSLIMGR